MFKTFFLLCFCALACYAQQNPGVVKADLPAQDEIKMWAIQNQESVGSVRYLRGDAKIETSDTVISADTIEFDSDTNLVTATGHVHMEHFDTGDKLDADHCLYNLKTQEGKFYSVDGTSPAKILTNPGVLTTTNPFYFQAKWAERIKDRYILHQGFLTDCKMPKPWWTMEAPVFDVIPGDRAIARHAMFRLKHVPIFYLPYFYRPLGKNPRSSGFLTPNIGHSSTYGYMVGAGYYWAINRSYDTTVIAQYLTNRGPAVRYDFRGKPNETTEFNFALYGVQDRGLSLGNGQVEKQGGIDFEITARTQIFGFDGRLDYNYLSSYLFRQAFSYSFATTIWSENNSIGYLQRRFKNDLYTLTLAMQREQLFEAVTLLHQAPNQVVIQKLPSLEFNGRDKQLSGGPIPFWFSFQSSAALMNRQEPTGTETSGSPPQSINTGAIARIDGTPRVMTEFNFKGFSLNPSVTFEATDYSNSYSQNSTTYTPIASCGGYPSCPPNPTVSVALASQNLFRKDADFNVDLRLPTIERIYTPPAWMHLGTKLKHVVESQATYEYVTGIDEFQKIIHFDQTDILSNTNQLTYSITNRLYKKDKNGNVNEFLTWKLAQARYFDPTFGGAVLPGQRNVVLATEELSPIVFLDGPRNYSPVVSTLTVSPYSFFSFDYRADFDPLKHKFLDHSIAASFRHNKYFGSVSETAITTQPLLVPQANQISFGGGMGNTNRRGWNAAATVDYDTLLNRRLYDFFQVSYNTDCCGFSMELRNFNLGIRNENQYLFSFSVANIGTFGSLQRQARIF